MITEIERSRSHIALTRAFNISPQPETDTDLRKDGLALAVARHGGTPELSMILAAADAIEDFTSGCAYTFEVQNVMAVTGLNKSMAENVLMMIGAHQKSPLTWCVGDNGKPFTLPLDLMRQWVQNNFPVTQ